MKIQDLRNDGFLDQNLNKQNQKWLMKSDDNSTMVITIIRINIGIKAIE